MSSNKYIEVQSRPESSKIYYKLQEMLSEHEDKFQGEAEGGVRSQSTLPPELNALARLYTVAFLCEDLEPSVELVHEEERRGIQLTWLKLLPDFESSYEKYENYEEFLKDK